jgi:CheY-like chemotaxis protein
MTVNSTNLVPYCFTGRDLSFQVFLNGEKGRTAFKDSFCRVKIAGNVAYLGEIRPQMKKRVLIFDDDEAILVVCAIVLETNGFETVTQSNCEDILQKVDQCAPDVILMDNKIPPLGGVRASRVIRSSPDHARLPIVFFSANQEVAKLAAEAGADQYIEKPFDLDALIAVLRRAIQPGD